MKEGDSMVYMKIHCGYCGGQWEVYSRQRDISSARICPHCDQRIDGDTWANKILTAFQAVGAANMALSFDHIEKHNAEYEVDFIADGHFRNADKGDIMNELQELRSVVESAGKKTKGKEKG